MIDVVVCAHNEEEYLERSLKSIFSQSLKPHRVIVILDRCTDNSEKIARGFPVEILVKNEAKWKNSYAENLQLGFELVKDDDCKFFGIVDADVILPEKYFEYMARFMDENKVKCASGYVVDEPKRKINRLIAAWKRFNLRFTPLGKRPRGCAMIIDKSFLREINGFGDVPAPDTYVQNEALNRGYIVELVSNPTVIVKHVRDEPFFKILKKQFQAGVARCELGTPFLRTLLHGIFRLRPLVIFGYAYAYYKKDKLEFILWVVALILFMWFLWWYVFEYIPRALR